MRISAIVSILYSALATLISAAEVILSGLLLFYTWKIGYICKNRLDTGFTVLKYVYNPVTRAKIQWDIESAKSLLNGLWMLLSGAFGIGLCVIFFIGAAWGLINIVLRGLRGIAGTDFSSPVQKGLDV